MVLGQGDSFLAAAELSRQPGSPPSVVLPLKVCIMAVCKPNVAREGVLLNLLYMRTACRYGGCVGNSVHAWGRSLIIDFKYPLFTDRSHHAYLSMIG